MRDCSLRGFSVDGAMAESAALRWAILCVFCVFGMLVGILIRGSLVDGGHLI